MENELPLLSLISERQEKGLYFTLYPEVRQFEKAYELLQIFQNDLTKSDTYFYFRDETIYFNEAKS